MSDPRRLSALVVNYESGAFAVRCVESLVARWREEGRDPDALEVVVVDNASPTDQSEALERCAAAGARVVPLDGNLGYAGGVNRAYERTSGAPDDVVAILNPDLHFLPGNVRTLMDWLAAHPECGVVGPRATIDEELVLNLPKNPLPTVASEVLGAAAEASPALCRLYTRRRLAETLPWWTATEPLATDMLSGCCLFLRREVADRLGGPLDERYPLYFEDTDFFRRLDALGLSVVQHVGTTILHHWSRSSGVEGQFMGEPLRRFRISRERYFREFYGPLGWGAVRAAERLIGLWPERLRHRPMHPVTPLGHVSEPVVLPLPRPARFLLELAMLPNWLLAVGIFGEGESWSPPPRTWDWFFPAEYYIRALDLDTREVLGAWSFRKTSPGRTTPLDEAEIAHLLPAGLREVGT